MAQQNIDLGSYPNDPTADAIRTAFAKTQNNFTELFSNASNTAVASINRVAAPGITVTPSSGIGNLTISANIACVQVHTSTLSIGRDANGTTDATITASSQVLFVDLPQITSFGTQTGITAAGSTQGTATLIGKSINVIGTATAGTGVVLPSTTGARIFIVNTGASTVNVYPNSGAQINALGTNTPYTLATSAKMEFISTSTTQWYTTT
jgi:hypothetical protein